jgi:hypothetical protein
LIGSFLLDRHENPEELSLVHGTVALASLQGTSSGKGGSERISHAWIELPGEVVLDSVAQRFYRRDAYYAFMEAWCCRRYTVEEVACLVETTGHPGPWSDDERAAARKE